MLYNALNQPVFDAIPISAKNILDLGCGTGSLGEAVKLRNQARVTGVTFAAEEANLARERLDDVLVADLDTFSPPPGFPVFDVIVCSHVLEHLLDASRLLSGIRPYLAPQGLLVIALPNVLHWKQRLRFLRGNFKYTQGGIMDTTHLRFYDWDAARALVTESGYLLSSARADGNVPLPGLRRFLPRFIASGLDRFGAKTFPGLFGAQFILAARSRTS